MYYTIVCFHRFYTAAKPGETLTKLGKKILLVERKALKRILGVKSGTTNNLIYQELDIPDIHNSCHTQSTIQLHKSYEYS